ncbi:hypothetical protein WJX81_007845 [Elliptochloris bilobata]|uniref:Uncharacterized protein n=1 Tax=Elliptochloris bilobata TaxID=381761 RepID=A0AAW1QK40_9CHLO
MWGEREATRARWMVRCRWSPVFAAALVLSCAWCAHAAPSPEDTLFIPGTVPYDTKGNKVEAHGGGMLQANGLYYWVGEGAKYSASIISKSINLYSSPDLATWTFEGAILTGDQIKGMPFPAPYRIERPKILWNAQTQHYVLFFHCDTPEFAYPAVGIARSQNITGPYTWVRVFKPDGEDSYDMTAYVDTDGTGYLIRSVGNVFLGISALTSDFLDTTGICSWGPRGEGPALFRAGDMSYMLMSGLTGWSPNPAALVSTVAPRLCGAWWVRQPNPATTEGGNTTFNSQSTAVLPLKLGDGSTLFIYMGDRWNFQGPGSTYNASYVWLPLLPRSGGQGFQILNGPFKDPNVYTDGRRP